MALQVLKQFALCAKSRKEAFVFYSWPSVIGLFIAYRGLPPPALILKIFLAITGMALGMYFYNDVCDFKQDVAGRELEGFAPSSRPLGSGLVSKRRMGAFSAILVGLGLTASALINLNVLLIQLVFLVVYFIYSTEPIRLKRVFLMKQVTVIIGGAIACLSPGLAVGNINVQLLYLTGLYILFAAGVNPVGDIRDMDSDRAGGVKTVPIVWGPGFTIRQALATFTACAVSTWVGFYGFGFNMALPIVGTVALAAFAYVVYPLIGRWGDYEYAVKRLYSWGFPLFILLQMAVLVGSFPI